nr:DUF3999 domain-containing protein [uncultured Desulfobulbus sp.]
MKFKQHLVLTFVLLTLAPLCPARASQPAPADFAYGMHLPVTDPNRLYTLQLPLEVYQNLYHADHSDLQVFNGEGEVVPQALQRAPLQKKVSRTAIPFFPLPQDSSGSNQNLALRVQRNKQGTILSIHGSNSVPVAASSSYLLDVSQSSFSFSKLELNWEQTATNQVFSLKVEQSQDLSHWQLITDQAVVARLGYQGAEVLRQDISLTGVKGPYLRLSCTDCAEPFQLTQVTALNGSSQNKDQYQWALLENGTMQEEQGWYRITYESPARFGVQAVDLEFPRENSLARVIIESRSTPQDTWKRVVQGDFFRLDIGGNQLISDFQNLGLNTDRYWRVSLPQSSALSRQALPKLTLGWRPESIIFLGRGPGPYTLAFGSSGKAQIDITQAALVVNALAQNGDKVPLNSLTPGPRFTLGGEQALAPQPTTIDWQRILLWIVLIGAVALLGFMAWSVAKEMQKTKT